MRKTSLLTRRSCKLLVFVAIWALLPVADFGQQVSIAERKTESFKTIFSHKYIEACSYLFSNKWISDTVKSYGIDPAFAISIVFPELIRYSAIQNSIETGGLFTLYVQYGQTYADFSVGHFQMKPTFAKQVEADLSLLSIPKTLKLDLNESEKARLERVKRLDSPLWQVRYLIYFVKIMDVKYASTVWVSQVEKLQFYATAYNCGYTLDAKKIKDRVYRKTFYTTIIKNSHCYCYAEIARDFYNTFPEKK